MTDYYISKHSSEGELDPLPYPTEEKTGHDKYLFYLGDYASHKFVICPVCGKDVDPKTDACYISYDCKVYHLRCR